MPAPLNLDSKYVDALILAILERHSVLLEGNESRRLDRNRQRSQAWEEVRTLVQPMIDRPLTVEAVKSTFKHRQMKIKRLLQGVKEDSELWQKIPELNGLTEAETRLMHYLSNGQPNTKEDVENELYLEDDKSLPLNSSSFLRSLLAMEDQEGGKGRKRLLSEDNQDDKQRKSTKLDSLLEVVDGKDSPGSSTQGSREDQADQYREQSVASDQPSFFPIPHLSQALEVSATPISYAASAHSESVDNQVPEAVIHAVVDRKAILLEDNMSRKACRNKQRCDAWEEVRLVAENASTSGTVTLDMVKGIFKYRQMKIRRIYEEYQSNKSLDLTKYNLTEAEQRLFDWYCTYQPPTHHRNSSGSAHNANNREASVANESGQEQRVDSPDNLVLDPTLFNLFGRNQDSGLLQLQKEVLQTQKEMFAEQAKMCNAVVNALNGFVNWLNNNSLNNNSKCSNCSNPSA